MTAVRPTRLPAPRIRGVGLLTGWGEGVGALPAESPASPPALLTVPTPALSGERFRRATRQCLLAAAAVRAALRDAGLAEDTLAGEGTGVLYVTATAYAGANRAFLEDEGSTTLHFPYTAPSAVPGEVTIEFGIRGPYVNLTGGGPAALHALWYAARWLAAGEADRVLVLGVETAHEVWDLFGRARRLYAPPIVEGAACLLLEPGPGPELAWASRTIWARRPGEAVGEVLDAVVAGQVPRLVAAGGGARGAGRAERAALARRGWAGAVLKAPGEALACGPLIGLGQARARGEVGPVLLTTGWRNDYGAMLWPMAA
jgi:Beta-ketoacyl synthase, N-terminal domain